MQVGMDLVRQARAAAKSNTSPANRDRQMAEAHRAALVRYEADLRRYQGRVSSYRAGTIAGGAGSAVLEYLSDQSITTPLLRLGLDDSFPSQGTREQILKDYRLDPESVRNAIQAFIQR